MLGYRGTTYPQKQTSRRCQEEFLTNGVETEITIEYKVSVEIKLPLNKHKKNTWRDGPFIRDFLLVQA